MKYICHKMNKLYSFQNIYYTILRIYLLDILSNIYLHKSVGIQVYRINSHWHLDHYKFNKIRDNLGFNRLHKIH